MYRPETSDGPVQGHTPAPVWNVSAKRDPELEIAIGARIRAVRLAARMSQGELGAAVGLRYQQVQKYETGKDRVPASTLVRFAGALGIHPGSFFDDGMAVPVGSIPDVKATMRAADVLHQIRDPRVLGQLLTLAKVLADVVPAFEESSITAGETS